MRIPRKMLILTLIILCGTAAAAAVSSEPEGNMALIDAVARNNIPQMESLLRDGADVHARDVHQNTALCWAAQVGNTEAATKLLEAGANVNDKNKEDRSVLMLTCLYDFLETARTLFDTTDRLGKPPPEVNYVNKSRMSALVLAIQYSRPEMIEYLVRKGANVGAEQDRAIFVAINTGVLEKVRVMVKNGSNIRAIHKDRGCTPLDMAREQAETYFGAEEMESFLVETLGPSLSTDGTPSRMNASSDQRNARITSAISRMRVSD